VNSQNKMLASFGGLATLAAVVIGGSVAAATHSGGAPAQEPAGQPVVTATVTASPTASPTEVASSRQVAAQRVAVVNPGDPVTTTPVPAPPATSDTSQPPIVDLGTGTVDEGGVRRAPNPTEHATPPPMRQGPPPEQIPSPSPTPTP
jgi:hypothetical protein